MPLDSSHIAVLHSRVDGHEKSLNTLWTTVDGFRETLNSVRVQVALIVGAFGVIQTVLTGVIVHYFTR